MVHPDSTNPERTGMNFKGNRFTQDNSFTGQLYKEEDFDKQFEQNVACPMADSYGEILIFLVADPCKLSLSVVATRC